MTTKQNQYSTPTFRLICLYYLYLKTKCLLGLFPKRKYGYMCLYNVYIDRTKMKNKCIKFKSLLNYVVLNEYKRICEAANWC